MRGCQCARIAGKVAEQIGGDVEFQGTQGRCLNRIITGCEYTHVIFAGGCGIGDRRS